MADRTSRVSKVRNEPGPFNVKTLPRESIVPITYELADRTSKVPKSEKSRPFNIKHSPGSLSCQSPTNWQIGCRMFPNSEKSRRRSTSKHSPGSLSCQSPTNWQIGRRRSPNSEKSQGHSTSKHSPGSLSCQSPMNWQIGRQTQARPEQVGGRELKRVRKS
jgi:hypothetical protein